MDYEATLREFIRSDLNGSLPEILLNRILEADSMKTFVRAFTHSSFSSDNYEILETRGDTYLTASFMNYLKYAFPTLSSPAIYSELKSYYTSKPFFNHISNKRNIVKYIRISNDLATITVDIAEDIFEAYAAAIYETCDEYSPDILGFRAGASVLGNYVTNIFNGYPISVTEVRSNPKVEFSMRMSKLHISYDTFLISYQGTRKTYYLVKKDDFKDIEISADRLKPVRELFTMENISKNPTSYFVIGYGTGYDKEASGKQASSDALRFLNENGFTHEEVEKINKQRVYGKDKEYAILAENLETEYPNYSFMSTTLSGGRTLTRLVSTDENGNIKELEHIITPHDEPKHEVQKRLLIMAQRLLQMPTPPFVYEPRPMKPVDTEVKVTYKGRTGTSQRPPTGTSQRPPTGTSQRPPTGTSQRPPTGTSQRPPTGTSQRPPSRR